MTSKRLTSLIRAVIICAGLVAIGVLVLVLPLLIKEQRIYNTLDKELAFAMLIWCIVIIICAIPCFIALVVGWKISEHMNSHSVISNDCVRLIDHLYHLALFDISILIIFIITSFFITLMNPPTLLLLIIIVGLGIIFALIFKVASLSLKEAVVLREESELTI